MGKRRTAHPSPSEMPETLHTVVPDAEVDLHGLTRGQAVRRVEMLLDTWERREGGAVLRIVTGKGNRSQGEAVLLRAVGDRLKQELGGRLADMTREMGGGGWRVRMAER